jgi:hypothetical protein
MQAVTQLARTRNLDLVFDKSAPSLNQVPYFLYTNSSFDLTETVWQEMNREQPRISNSPRNLPAGIAIERP